MQDLAGWDDQPLSAFPDGTWQPVVPAPAVRVPDTALAPVQMPPIRIVETRRAVSIRKIDQVNTNTDTTKPQPQPQLQTAGSYLPTVPRVLHVGWCCQAPGTTSLQCNASSGHIGGEASEDQFGQSMLKLACTIIRANIPGL